MKEKWINEIEGYEECGKGYKIREDGQVVSYKNGKTITDTPQKVMKQQCSKGTKGYCLITLGGGKTAKIHRLVALAFIPNEENKPQVNHKDGDKTNNHVNNLEWATNGENQIHAHKMGLNSSLRGDDNPYWNDIEKYTWMKERVPLKAYDKDMNFIGEFKSIGDASRKLGIIDSTINRAMRGGYLCKKKYYFIEIFEK